MQNSMSPSREERCAETQLGKTSCAKEEDSSNTSYAHKIDAYESPRFRFEEIFKQKHEEHGADHGYNSVSLHKQVHLPIPIPMRSPKSWDKFPDLVVTPTTRMMEE